MDKSKEFNKRKLENKVNNINDSIDALMTKPKRSFKLKQPEIKTQATDNDEIQEIEDQGQAADNLEFNEMLKYLPGTLGKEFFTITKKEFDAITGTISELSHNDIHTLRNLQTKLFVTYQYIQDGLGKMYEEEARLEGHYDGVNEKIGELGSLLRSLNRNKEKIDQEQIENFKQRKQLIHQHSMLNEREKKIQQQEEDLIRKNNDLNAFRLTLEDRQKALELQENKMHVFREKVLSERSELDQLKTKIIQDDYAVDEKYFEIKKQKSLLKKQKETLQIEINTFKNIRSRARSIRDEARKAEETLNLKKRTINRMKQQMEFQKKAFLAGKVNYQKLVDQVDKISTEIDKLEHRRQQLISENLELHDQKSKAQDHLNVLRQVTSNEVEGLTTEQPPKRSIRPARATLQV